MNQATLTTSPTRGETKAPDGDGFVLPVIRSIPELRERVSLARRDGLSVGLVPTMGALHRGHGTLIDAAKQVSDFVVVSVFVNPTQFGPGEDFDHYPRTLREDVLAAAQSGADIVFAPSADQVYPAGNSTTVAVSGLTEVLCGAPEHRGPEHFAGVATVVTKLFNIVQPDIALFGQKDAQQAAVIKRIVRDLHIPVKIAVQPTVRDPDGLALSSRNVYLSDAERSSALSLGRALDNAARAFAAGERTSPELLKTAAAALTDATITVEYLKLVDAESLLPISLVERPALLAVAARIGNTRLIDNQQLDPARPDAARSNSQPTTDNSSRSH